MNGIGNVGPATFSTLIHFILQSEGSVVKFVHFNSGFLRFHDLHHGSEPVREHQRVVKGEWTP